MNEQNDKTLESTKGKRLHKTVSYMREAIKELGEGKIQFNEWLEKHNLSKSAGYRWIKDIRKYDPAQVHRKNNLYSKEQQLMVVKQIVLGQMDVNEARKKYNIKSSTSILNWLEKYSCQIELHKNESPLAIMKEQDAVNNEERIKQLEKTLQEANLKIVGLETMINIAEKELKINIRKKSGTKQ